MNQASLDTTHNQPEFSVSDISLALKRTVEQSFSHVRVRGEISGLKRAASGHVYLSLKDDQSVLNAICWKGKAASLSFQPEDGLEVIATGKISTYPGRSNYQLIIDSLEIAGEGALMALLEKRKKQMAAEGLFAEERKRALPFCPQHIGVVTSPTGAVIKDILHRVSDRYPVHVSVWPVLVQGEGAKEEITAAIEGFNRLPEAQRPELLIVARGGGSLEDLWAFNEEEVVRAAANSEIPLISAVGHETDTTLIDYVSDKRAPTPTAAAEMAVPVRDELLSYVMESEKRLFVAINRFVQDRGGFLDALSRGLTNPMQLLGTMIQRLDDWTERLGESLPRYVTQKRVLLDGVISRLQPSLVKRLVDQQAEHLALRGRLSPEVVERFLLLKRQQYESFQQRLQPSMLLRSIESQEQELLHRGRLDQVMIERSMDRLSERLQHASQLLESYHFQKVLDRGFALVRDESGGVVMRAAEASKQASLSIQFADGEVASYPEPNKPKKPKSVAKTVTPEDDQGSLF